MNYLAHLLLNGEEEALIVGNFLADQLRPREQAALEPRYQEGIRLHRFIDHYTDQHPEVIAMLGYARPIYRKYAPVALDVYMDYLLSSEWSRWTEEAWHPFKRRIYNTLSRHTHVLPEEHRLRIERMIYHDWLDDYDDLYGLSRVMAHMDQRARYDPGFEVGLPQLHAHQKDLRRHFIPFMTDLQRAVARYRFESLT